MKTRCRESNNTAPMRLLHTTAFTCALIISDNDGERSIATSYKWQTGVESWEIWECLTKILWKSAAAAVSNQFSNSIFISTVSSDP